MVAGYKPDLVGFGVYSYTEDKADKLSRDIKNNFKDIPILHGGIHTTIKPKEVLSKDWVDMICLGEGELALADLCDAIEQGGKNAGECKVRRENSL